MKISVTANWLLRDFRIFSWSLCESGLTLFNIADLQVLEKLKKSYSSIVKRVGDPLDDGTLYGPLHSKQGVQAYQKTIQVQTDR